VSDFRLNGFKPAVGRFDLPHLSSLKSVDSRKSGLTWHPVVAEHSALIRKPHIAKGVPSRPHEVAHCLLVDKPRAPRRGLPFWQSASGADEKAIVKGCKFADRRGKTFSRELRKLIRVIRG
jgi:hypothetical protein